MGHRTLKRVPLNFKAPLHTVWKGYINPYPGPRICKYCEGSGYNSATKQIAADFYGDYTPNTRRWSNNITQDEVQALVDAGRLWELTHVPLNEEQKKDMLPNGLLPYFNGKIPTVEEVNAWSEKGIGHDCVNCDILVETRAKRLGVYGACPHCKGRREEKLPRKLKKKYNGWKEYDPPTGDGFQLWETTSGGGPLSPVFATAEELADWCAKNETIFGDREMTSSEWLKFTEDSLESKSLIAASSNGHVWLTS